jgi:hypothetical protein
MIKRNELCGACVTYGGVWGRRDVYTAFWWGNLRERNYLKDVRIYGRIILKWTLKNWDGGTWTGLVWLRIGTDGVLVNTTMNHGVP